MDIKVLIPVHELLSTEMYVSYILTKHTVLVVRHMSQDFPQIFSQEVNKAYCNTMLCL